MSAQHSIDVTTAVHPRWTPVIVPLVATPVPQRRLVPTIATATSAEAVAALRPASRASAWRRRIGAVAVLVLFAFLLTVAIGRVSAGADLADPVAGTITVGPGETLWDVAAATAPAGVGVQEQLAAIASLNGFDGGAIEPWTVVLLPVR